MASSDLIELPQLDSYELPLDANVFRVGPYWWNVSECVGSGKFGDVFIAHNDSKPDQQLVVKLKEPGDSPLEEKVLEAMSGSGAPLLEAVEHTDACTCVIMERCGPSIDRILRERLNLNPKQPFSLSEVSSIGIRCFTLLERLHNLGFVHGDIKPANFVFGKEYLQNMSVADSINSINIIDFGLSRHWRSDELGILGGEHVEYSQSIHRFSGTLRYASLHAHCGRRLSRRDDIESLVYMLLHLLKGQLPWQGLKGNEESQHFRIFAIKGSIPVAELCKGLPEEIQQLVCYVRSLGFSEDPDYHRLRMLISCSNSKSNHKTADFRAQEYHGPTNPKRRRISSTIEMHPMAWQWYLIVTGKVNGDGLNSSASGQLFIENCDRTLFSNEVNQLLSKRSLTSISFDVESGSWKAAFVSRGIDGEQRGSHLREKIIFYRLTEDISSILEAHRSAGCFVRHIACSDSYFCIYVTNCCRVEDQLVFSGTYFPRDWCQNLDNSGYFISSMSSFQDELYIVMSKFAFGRKVLPFAGDQILELDSQRVELMFGYSSSIVRHWWDSGYVITSSVCLRNGASIFVFSKPICDDKGQTDWSFKQRCHRTMNVHKRINEAFHEGMTVTSLHPGRTQ